MHTRREAQKGSAGSERPRVDWTPSEKKPLAAFYTPQSESLFARIVRNIQVSSNPRFGFAILRSEFLMYSPSSDNLLN